MLRDILYLIRHAESDFDPLDLTQRVSWISLNGASTNCSRRGLRPPMGIARSADGAASFYSYQSHVRQES